MKIGGQIRRLETVGDAHSISVGKPEGKRLFERAIVDERIIF
jgi:hypothetical protein